MIALREWFRARSVREQRLLAVMAAIAVPMILWLGLALPLGRAYDRALERQLEAVDRNGRIKALLSQKAEGVAAAPAGDLILLIGDSARQAGLQAETQPQGPSGAQVTVAAASPQATLAWVNGLETQGFVLSDLRMAPDAKGGVSVTATVRSRTR